MGKPTSVSRRRKAKSKAEADTGAKENAVEVRTAAKIGDNSQLKLPAPADWEHHFKSIRGCLDKENTAKRLTQLACEAANKVRPGLAKKVKEMLKLENKNDPAALLADLELHAFGLKQINSPIQLSVFDGLQGDVEEQAYKRGLADAHAGRTATNPYPDGSDLSLEYGRGWRHGTADNLNVSREDADAAAAEADNGAAAAFDAPEGDSEETDEEDEELEAAE